MAADHRLEIILAAKEITQRAFSDVQKRLHGIQSAVFSLKGALATFGIGFGFTQMASQFLDVAASFEQMEVKLDALTRGRGRQTLEEINQWALEMPVNTRKAVDTFAMMQAFGLDPTIEKMQTLVDVSSIFGEEAMPRVARALGQMRALGKLSAEELNQLSEAGINARKYLTQAFGMTVEELKKSQITIEQIIEAIWRGLNADYSGAAAKAQKSWRGMTLTFRSYLEEIQREVMKAGVFDTMKTHLDDINSRLKTWLESNRELIKLQIPVYIEKTENALKKIWDIVSYDPAIIEWGIIGLALGGKKGAVIAGSMAHMVKWAENLGHAFALAEKGVISFREIATANFKELEELIERGRKKLQEMKGAIPDMMHKAHGATLLPAHRATDQLTHSVKELKKAADEAAESMNKVVNPPSPPGQQQFAPSAQEWRRWMQAEKLKRDATPQAQDYEAMSAAEWNRWVWAIKQFDDAAKHSAHTFRDEFTGAFWAAEDALVDFVTSGKMNLADFTNFIMRDIARMAVSQILSPAKTWLAELFPSAQGNVFDRHGIFPMAKGSVIDRPTIFPFASGAGIMGEEGPEAVMPLIRLPDGDLGIKADVSGSGDVRVVIKNYLPITPTVKQKTFGSSREIEIQIGNMVSRGGPLAQAIENAYGLKRYGRQT